jgi:UPF0755 protein
MSEGAQDARGAAPRWRRVALALAASLLLGAGAAAAWIAWTLAPADRAAGTTRVDVLHGDSLWKVARALERGGIVRDARAMVWLARWRGVDTAIRAGEYAVSASWGTARVLEQLVSGQVITYEVVLPEGLTAVEIAARLAEQGLVRADEFVAWARDPASASQLGVEGPGLEGYLFPETYRMPHGLSTQQVAKILVDEFLERWRPLEASARERGFGMRQTVTLASIVEKETGVASERPLVASVFWKRLRRGMRLESDPTTIYGIANFDGNLTRAHLEDASNPWNTYRIAGLPPSPIANPGEASLAAVVHPAESDYLFFVAQGDGSHVFARSFAEHDANVHRYQRRRSSR